MIELRELDPSSIFLSNDDRTIQADICLEVESCPNFPVKSAALIVPGPHCHDYRSKISLCARHKLIRTHGSVLSYIIQANYSPKLK